ncbi:hypothetical protein MP228_010757 [Amoeboaphelidium protococcarum]|nr:hypothetical protein MP228_010757 [Amoeboaphelidium protococcarum]
MWKQFIKNGRKIVAVGRNYVDHAKELGNDVPKSPIIFLKPTSSYCVNDSKVLIPKGTNVHHEVELGVVIGKRGSNVPKSDALDLVGGYTLALDMTARDLQQLAARNGLPWTESKGYDTFTPISDVIEKSLIPHPHDVDLMIQVNGQVRQSGNTRDMLFDIPSIIQHVSHIMTLEEGDVILTGTPSGVSQVVDGDRMHCTLSYKGKQLASLNCTAKDRSY